MTGITTATLNIRGGIGTTFPAIGVVEKGVPLNIVGSAKNTDGTIWYKIDKGWVSSKYVEIKSAIPPTSVMTGNSVNNTMSLSEIQAVFNKAGTIIVKKGIYKILGTVFAKSNSKIIFEDGAIFMRMKQCPVFSNIYSSTSVMYNAAQNIEIIGGHFVGNGIKVGGNVVVFFHAKNIKFRKFKITGSVYSHSLEINACENVEVDDFDIYDHLIEDGNAFREAIQYDNAQYHALPYFNKNSKCYDNTHCHNITISNGRIKDHPIGIGTHTQTSGAGYHNIINIINCKITGMGLVDWYGSGIKLMNVRNSNIEGNTIENCDKGIEIVTSNRFYDKDGTEIKTKPRGAKGGCYNIDIKKNTIKNPTGTATCPGVFFNSKFVDIQHDGIHIDDNTFIVASNPNSKYIIYSNGTATHVTHKTNIHDLGIRPYLIK